MKEILAGRLYEDNIYSNGNRVARRFGLERGEHDSVRPSFSVSTIEELAKTLRDYRMMNVILESYGEPTIQQLVGSKDVTIRASIGSTVPFDLGSIAIELSKK